MLIRMKLLLPFVLFFLGCSSPTGTSEEGSTIRTIEHYCLNSEQSEPKKLIVKMKREPIYTDIVIEYKFTGFAFSGPKKTLALFYQSFLNRLEENY